MGWLHEFNLKRKVAGVLAAHRGQPLTSAAIARQAKADEREVEQLVDLMEKGDYVKCVRQDGTSAYLLNEAQPTVGRVLHAFQDKEQEADGNLILRHDESGWTAELPDPAGLMVRGGTREEARERGFALMEKMAALPTSRNRIETASRQI